MKAARQRESNPPATRVAPSPSDSPLLRFFVVLFGALLGLALLKFGNPPVMEKFIEWPGNGYEWAISNWPVVIGHWLLAGTAVLGAMAARWQINAPRWMVFLPLGWLSWQVLAGTQSVDATLTGVTLRHFVACVVCFYLGLFALAKTQRPLPFWAGILGAFAIVIAVGWEQHFGGLAESRRYFFTYIYPEMPVVAPEYLKKISSDRIFSTLFYPNALAGAVLLVLPPSLVALWMCRFMTPASRIFLMGVVGIGALACLYWSGSKGGWLLMLILGMAVLMRLNFPVRWKVALVAAVLLVGLTGFFWKYSGFFQRGATSVSARFDYWQAAVRTATAHPIFGTGPGTFAIAYEKIKRPESEMARLTHNDYLQQASDSGVIGMVTYAAFVAGVLIWTAARGRLREDWLRFAVWLGLMGWALQGLLEFGLYIPALAWPAFALLGWLLGVTGNPIDKTRAGS